jgi:hypothetical protein
MQFPCQRRCKNLYTVGIKSTPSGIFPTPNFCKPLIYKGKTGLYIGGRTNQKQNQTIIYFFIFFYFFYLLFIYFRDKFIFYSLINLNKYIKCLLAEACCFYFIFIFFLIVSLLVKPKISLL